MISESIGVDLASPLRSDPRVGEPSSGPEPDHSFVVLLIEPTPEDRFWPAQIILPLVREWAASGRSVVLMDGDVVEPNLHLALGLPNREGLSDWAGFGASLERLVQVHPDIPFRFLSAGNLWADAPALFQSHRWTSFLDGVRERGDLAVLFLPLDRLAPSPSEMDPRVIALLARADLRIMVNRVEEGASPAAVESEEGTGVMAESAESEAGTSPPKAAEPPLPPRAVTPPVYGAKRRPTSGKRSFFSRLLFPAFLILIVIALGVVAIQMGILQVPGLEDGIPGLPRLP